MAPVLIMEDFSGILRCLVSGLNAVIAKRVLGSVPVVIVDLRMGSLAGVDRPGIIGCHHLHEEVDKRPADTPEPLFARTIVGPVRFLIYVVLLLIVPVYAQVGRWYSAFLRGIAVRESLRSVAYLERVRLRGYMRSRAVESGLYDFALRDGCERDCSTERDRIGPGEEIAFSCLSQKSSCLQGPSLPIPAA